MKIPVEVKTKVDVYFDQVCKLMGKKELKLKFPSALLLLEKSVFIVEANSYEIGVLWNIYKDRGFPSLGSASYSILIGHIVEREIWIQLMFLEIKEKWVCFFEMTGNYAFGEICSRFFEQMANELDRTDADNFHNVMRMIESGK